jgi:hypothetical protein
MKHSNAFRLSLNIKFMVGKLWDDATIEKGRPLDVTHTLNQVFSALVTVGATFN